MSSVCARVDSLLKKQLLVEDGKKLSTETNKHRNVLRLFDPAVDSNSRKIHDLILVLLARLNDVGKGREQIKFAGMLPLTPSDGECYRLAKRALCEQLNRQINWLRTQVEAPEAH